MVHTLPAIVKYKEFWEAKLLFAVFKGSRPEVNNDQSKQLLFWSANLGFKNEFGKISSILETLSESTPSSPPPTLLSIFPVTQ